MRAKLKKKMKLTIFSALIIAISIILLAIKLVLKRDGKFPNLHIDESDAMKSRGIQCAVKQDFEARKIAKKRIKE